MATEELKTNYKTPTKTWTNHKLNTMNSYW